MSTDPVSHLADTARAALRAGGADERTLASEEIRAVVAASAPAVSIVRRHQFTDSEIDAAVQALEALFVVSQGPTIRLRGELRPDDWYFGDRRRPGRFMARYLQKLSEDGWAPRPIEALAESTAEVMESIDDPDRAGPWDWRGLVVGNVQSGKTAHYAGLINRAADAGYRVIIVLAGMQRAPAPDAAPTRRRLSGLRHRARNHA